MGVDSCVLIKLCPSFNYLSLPAHARLPGHGGAGGWGRSLIWPTIVWALQVQDHLKWTKLLAGFFSELRKKGSKQNFFLKKAQKYDTHNEYFIFLMFFLTCSLAGGSLCGSEVKALRSSEMVWRWVTSPNMEISSSYKDRTCRQDDYA